MIGYLKNQNIVTIIISPEEYSEYQKLNVYPTTILLEREHFCWQSKVF